MLKELAERHVSLFDEDDFNSPIGLFQRHFLLFHCLYLLRDTLLKQADVALYQAKGAGRNAIRFFNP